tara:strand:- start:90 stop:371 length:282 start_codon:yes stop_codon:yes gene_type:complete
MDKPLAKGLSISQSPPFGLLSGVGQKAINKANQPLILISWLARTGLQRLQPQHTRELTDGRNQSPSAIDSQPIYLILAILEAGVEGIVDLPSK